MPFPGWPANVTFVTGPVSRANIFKNCNTAALWIGQCFSILYGQLEELPPDRL